MITDMKFKKKNRFWLIVFFFFLHSYWRMWNIISCSNSNYFIKILRTIKEMNRNNIRHCFVEYLGMDGQDKRDTLDNHE